MNDTIDGKALESTIGDIFSGFVGLRQSEEDTALARALAEPESEVGKAFKMIDEASYDSARVTVFDEAEKVFGAILRQKFQSPDARSAVANYQFFSSHFSMIILRHEGRSCYVDKSRNILRQLIRFFETGKRIAFDPAAEYTFSHPKRVLTTHEGIVCFFHALQKLRGGRFDDYLVQLGVIAEEARASEERAPTPTLERWLKRLDMLAALGDDHDGEGAAAPNPASIEEARSFLKSMQTRTGVPVSTLTDGGHAVIEFHEGKTFYGSITFDGSGGVEVYVAERKGVASHFYEGPLVDDKARDVILEGLGIVQRGVKYRSHTLSGDGHDVA
jgi:hypothetical protein